MLLIWDVSVEHVVISSSFVINIVSEIFACIQYLIILIKLDLIW